MNLKNAFSVIIFLLFCAGIFKLHAQSNLSVVFQDGSNEQISIGSINTIKFTNDGMNINMGSGTTSVYTFSSIRKLLFKTVSGVNELLDNTSQIQIYPNPVKLMLYLKNVVDSDLKIKIFRSDGALVFDNILSSAQQCIDVSQLNQGLYVLQVNNQTIKFAKL
ncbi:MAG: T9SS type A sorting domain-containing protein [Paludibacter sp.]|nr:T9SS type A sorting domain-containing protein [Paludibacter sp.]